MKSSLHVILCNIMPHIHNKLGQHDTTVTACIVRVDLPEPKMLLHMHRKLGKLLPFGGHVELNEDPWDAIEHEILEESGYQFGQLKVLLPKARIKSLTGVKLHPIPVACNTHLFTIGSEHFHTDMTYAFIAHGAPKRSIVPGESVDIQAYTLKEILAMDESRMNENIKEIVKYIFTECLLTYEPVPATSFISNNKRVK